MNEAHELVRRQFGDHAQHYVLSSDHAQGESLDRLSDWLPLEPGWRALDVATGGGHTALALAGRVRHVAASDLTVPMLRAAQNHAQRRGIDNLSFPAADASRLPFRAGAFDLVTCRLAAHHFPDPDSFVHESARVLRPGGWLALIDNVTPPEGRAARHVNAFEKLRDPSHQWEHSAPDWEAFCRAARLEPRLVEYYRKPLDFEPWCERMSVPPLRRQQLRVLLWHAPAASRQALLPEFAGDPATGPVRFSLGELLLVAQRA
jgi:ubiquinone/menaquinone biosynthesis C-methylase UbiE